MNNKEKYKEAVDTFKNGKYEETVKIISELLKHVHPHPPLLILLGRSLIELDKPLNALLALKKYRAEVSEDTHLLLLLAETYTALFLNELAIQTFQKCIDSNTFYKEDYLHFIRAIIQDDCVDKMISVFSKELKKNPSFDELRCVLGMMHLYINEKQEALLYADQLKERGSSLASKLFQMIEQDDPKAEKIEINASKIKAKEHYLAALQFMMHKEIDMATKEFIAALKLDSKFVEAYTLLGCLYDKCGLIDEGFTLHKKAIEINPEYAVAYNNIGYIYQVKGDYEKAFNAYHKALELDPDLVQAHNSIGFLYDLTEDYEKGISHFKQALKRDPKREGTWMNLAVAYHALGEMENSINALKELIGINPKSLDARQFLIRIYKKLHRNEDAYRELSELKKITKKLE